MKLLKAFIVTVPKGCFNSNNLRDALQKVDLFVKCTPDSKPKILRLNREVWNTWSLYKTDQNILNLIEPTLTSKLKKRPRNPPRDLCKTF